MPSGGIRLARGGGVLVVLFLAPSAAAFLVSWLGGPRWLEAAAWSLLFLAAGMLFFFRDPEREPGPGVPDDRALSPSDGKVVAAREGSEGTFVALYLNLLDVHVVRAPLEGRLQEVRIIEGGHRRASSAESMANTGAEYTAGGARGVWTLRMLAGLLVRRVVPYLGTREEVGRGARVGLIRFGSRVETTLPAGYRLLVEPGQRVRAGETPLAEGP
ncbi:MAG: phosphatidylserine decarboxylase [bacterium]